jgi:IS605 OrfB family transposase
LRYLPDNCPCISEGIRDIKKQGYDKSYETILIKEKYKEYYDEQRNRKLHNKLSNRVFAVDINPEYIGFSVLDKRNNNIKVVKCGLISFKKLMNKTHKKSDSFESKYRNNKHKYEVTIVVKYLFKTLMHYRCSGFIIEDLFFKIDKDNRLSTEVNRKIRNIWYRSLLLSCITRRCNENGVELIRVNPCYSSFIGNIQ